MDPLNMVYNTALLSVFDVLGITASSVVCMYFRLYVPLSDIQTQPKDHVLRRPGEVLQRPVLLRGGILPPAEEPPLRQPCQLQGPRIW